MADKSLKRIAITTEGITVYEPERIVAVLESGWDMVHLRHPGASLREMRRLIETIPQKLHRRLRIHGHFELTNEFNLGGLHLNRRCPSLPANYRGPFSCSCHSIEEAKRAAKCDYVTLSPIFDSVSKQGYQAAFSEKDLAEIDKTSGSGVITEVIALGGITPERLREVKRLGFNGFATLGSLMGADSHEAFRAKLNEFNNEYNLL